MASSDTRIPYPEYMKLSEGWAEFFYDDTTEAILLPILAELSLSSEFYPPRTEVFKCFYMTPLEKVRVVWLAEEPYHDGSATGLALETRLGYQTDARLEDIYDEIEAEGFFPTRDGQLSQWATQGVLLLHRTLTVPPHTPSSHTDIWRPFFDHLFQFLLCRDHLVWLLLGREFASLKADVVMANEEHTVVEASAPLGNKSGKTSLPSFRGSNVFRNVNDALRKRNLPLIVW